MKCLRHPHALLNAVHALIKALGDHCGVDLAQFRMMACTCVLATSPKRKEEFKLLRKEHMEACTPSTTPLEVFLKKGHAVLHPCSP